MWVSTIYFVKRSGYVRKWLKIIWIRVRCILIWSLLMWWLFFSLRPTLSSQDMLLFQELDEKVDQVLEDHPERAKHIFLRIHWVYWYNSKTNRLKWMKKHQVWEMLIKLKKEHIDPLKMEWLSTDWDIRQFITNWIWYSTRQYVPEDLVLLQPSSLIEFKEEEDFYLHKEAIQPLLELAEAYFDQYSEWFLVTSTWRSYEEQRDWFDDECKGSWLCAYAWYSEHQSWLAVDLARMVWRGYTRMSEHAHEYWFHQSYQKWKEIDYYQREDRHWRYLWEELATELYENKQTFTEWYMLHSLVQDVAENL